MTRRLTYYYVVTAVGAAYSSGRTATVSTRAEGISHVNANLTVLQVTKSKDIAGFEDVFPVGGFTIKSYLVNGWEGCKSGNGQ